MSSNIDIKFSGTGNEKLFIRNLKGKNANDIRFIDHNKEYYSCLDSDAELIADEIYKTRSVLKTQNGVTYITMSTQVFFNALRLTLLEKQLRVEVYNSRTYELICKGTAGNLDALVLEYGVDFEFRDCSNPSIAAVKIVGESNKVGVCLIEEDIIRLCEFEDNDLLSNLEGLLVQFGVKEVVVPNLGEKRLMLVINKISNIVVSTSTQFNTKYIEQDLVKLLAHGDEAGEAGEVGNDAISNNDNNSSNNNNNNNLEMAFSAKGIKMTEHPISLSCCNALISYLGLLEEQTDLSTSRAYHLEKYDLLSFMKLDSSTLKALNVFPEFKSTTISSIFELLNKCKTAGGSRLLSQWLKQPLTLVDEIEERQTLVALLINDSTLRVSIQNALTQIPDIKRLLKKLTIAMMKNGNENKKLEDLVRLYQIVLVLPELIEALTDKDKIVDKFWLEPIKKLYSALLKFQELIETTVDLKGLHDLHSNFDIRPEFDASLVEINEKKTEAMDRIKQLHLDAADDLNMDVDKKLKLEMHQIHGYCMRLTRNDSVVLRNNRKYIEIQTVKAGVYFTTSEFRKQAQVYTHSCEEYNHKQRELIREVISISLTYLSVFTKLSLDLSHLDVINSFANAALLAPTTYVRPKMIPLDSEKRVVNVKNSRHPLLEVQEDVEFIPNDISIGSKFFNIITGPNMGGKSTYLKQIATLALMAQVGSFIPADDLREEEEEEEKEEAAAAAAAKSGENKNGAPTLPVFDAILSRVGAGDSQLKGLSTFMIEMLETSSILATATRNSLIIIDELGRGTSTYDGFGLAWSISDHLIQVKKCITLFATHFHELNQLAKKYPLEVENLHVVAYVENQDDITLMYKIEPGVSNKSFGINVAEMVNFPEKIIKMAKRKAEELEDMKGDGNGNVSGNEDGGNGKKLRGNRDELWLEVENLKKVLKEWRGKDLNAEEAPAELKRLLERNSSAYVKELINSL
ncbi:conserved hypothetical protein [Lodderomyces elongisporus NRRL YB-4239]|uniref:DNA mismatch repair proteins mutS family domain-containing protein n=1 Tax=Lodderomyces elongisporus (strain ATCC 11503 / CBS 2605 / JCM 1781 / NBRC 1676 / NRRL YB-4239) TaxID=379508 RepID=A5E7V9_LODEL|nr:conserved hypothetical protein [Lodderomyces elongisporus NRRL YB-4239]